MFTKQLLSTIDIFGASASSKSAALNDLFAVAGASEQPRHECFFDESSSSDLPSIIIPYNDDEDGFFADVATYYPAWSPITAHVHVIPSDQIPDKSSLTRSRAKAKISNNAQKRSQLSIWSALAYSEAVSLSALHNLSEQDPSYGLCRRTLAFALARANLLYPLIGPAIIAKKWNMLRALTMGESNQALADTVVFLASVLREERLLELDEQFSEILPVLRDVNLHEYQVGDEHIARYLLEFHPDIANLVVDLAGDFDGRMESFHAIVGLIKTNPHSEVVDTVTIAFFANRILTGSMRYGKVLTRFLSIYPTILIWYGFFSALSERYVSESAILPIDRKLQRDIAQYFDFRITPSVDISIVELNTLSRVGLKSIALRPVQPRSIFISLLPGIDIHVKFGDDISESGNRDAENSRQLKQRDRLLANLLSEAQKILDGGTAEAPSKNTKGRYNRDRY